MKAPSMPRHLSPILALALLSAVAQGQSTFMVDSAQNGTYGNLTALGCSPSFDGRWMCFTSNDSNIHPTASGQNHVYVKDLATWGVELVSVATSGSLGNSVSYASRMSHDGRYVVFLSNATNLGGGINGLTNVFLRDRWSGTTTAQNVSAVFTPANLGASLTTISGDGRLVLFLSKATNLVPGINSGLSQVYLRDHVLNTLAAAAVSTAGVPANADIGTADLSGDGRFVVFDSDATNLVAGDTNGARDIFLRDQVLGTTVRASVTGSGQQANGNSHDAKISSDGRYVIYVTNSTNVVVPDTNGRQDVIVYDTQTGAAQRMSDAWNGAQSNGDSDRPSISFDGRYVAFESYASNLITGDSNGGLDIFVRDRSLGQIEIASVATGGAQGAGNGTYEATISPNGRFVCMTSQDSLVVPPAAGSHAYARERGLVCITPYAYCTSKVNSLGCTPFIAIYGCSSASVTSGCYLLGVNVRNNKTGLLFYSLFGQAANPFQGGTLCVAAPRKRTPARDSAGNAAPANDCSGLFVIDMNQFASGLGGGNPRPELSVPGTVVDCQWWSRDPGSSFNVNLTNALEYVVGL